MIVNYSNQEVIKGEKSIFLAGPTPRSSDVETWRKEAIHILNDLGFDGIVYVPEFNNEDRTFDLIKQVWWEREALFSSSVIVFWIPRSDVLPGYTTNIEFGYWMAKDKGKVIYGRPDNSIKNNYLDWLYQTETQKEAIKDLKELLEGTMILVEENKARLTKRI